MQNAAVCCYHDRLTRESRLPTIGGIDARLPHHSLGVTLGCQSVAAVAYTKQTERQRAVNLHIDLANDYKRRDAVGRCCCPLRTVVGPSVCRLFPRLSLDLSSALINCYISLEGYAGKLIHNIERQTARDRYLIMSSL